MIKYERTAGGYYYKVFENGDKKRVSKEVFDKNVMKGGGVNINLSNNLSIILAKIYKLLDNEVYQYNMTYFNKTSKRDVEYLYKILLKRQEIRKIFIEYINTMTYEEFKNFSDIMYIRIAVNNNLIHENSEIPTNLDTMSIEEMIKLWYLISIRIDFRIFLEKYEIPIPNNLKTMSYEDLKEKWKEEYERLKKRSNLSATNLNKSYKEYPIEILANLNISSIIQNLKINRIKTKTGNIHKTILEYFKKIKPDQGNIISSESSNMTYHNKKKQLEFLYEKYDFFQYLELYIFGMGIPELDRLLSLISIKLKFRKYLKKHRINIPPNLDTTSIEELEESKELKKILLLESKREKVYKLLIKNGRKIPTNFNDFINEELNGYLYSE